MHVQAYTRADDGQLLEDSRDFYAPLEDAAARRGHDEEGRRGAWSRSCSRCASRRPSIPTPGRRSSSLTRRACSSTKRWVIASRANARTTTPRARRSAGRWASRCCPPFISVTDDPTATARGGKQLNGHYLFDEEGVRAQKVTLVKAGVLQTYLLSRRPVEGFLKSNGHGRAQGNRKPVARMANLIIESTKRVPAAQLKQQLIAEAKRQGKPFGLVIRDITGGNTNTTSFGYQAFKGTPRMVYRVDLKTGLETLVRGVEIVGTPLSSINRILGTGETDGVFNGFCGAESGMVPVSTVSPSVLLQEIELQRALEGKDRPPLIPSPVSLTK